MTVVYSRYNKCIIFFSESVLLELLVTVHVAQIMNDVQLLEPTRPNFCVVDKSYLYVCICPLLLNKTL